MTQPRIEFERVPGHEHIIRIPLTDVHDPQACLEVLQDTFETCFKNEEYQIIVDLRGVRYPSTRLVALLVEMTSRLRRRNGDLKIINLSFTARRNLATFSPESYLSVERDEDAAVEGFAGFPGDLEAPEIPAEDIVDDPIIDKLEESFSEEKRTTVQAPPEEASPKEATPKSVRKHLQVKSAAQNLYTICDFVTDYAQQAGFSDKDLGKTKIAVYEACLNVIEHAYHSNPDNVIDIWVEYDAERFVVEIRDYGIGFEGFGDHKQYDVHAALDDRRTGGFGLYIIRRSMDEIEYQADEANGNVLRMTKYIKADGKQEIS
ncbi:MAG: hypothetical protein D6743_00760 [Calditrichaeota bacterium]|nr:MAG: hypothetical protein D6743_00760 [Calditrichota bacterium]